MTINGSVGIGIIGTGFARSTQIPGFKACEGARLVGIASAHPEQAEEVARAFDIEYATADWRSLIKRDEIDLISIVTPPPTHMEMALAALDAGKAVLCEKPMAMSATEADHMRARAGATGQLALIDHELRFVPARRRMREMLRDGEIGRVRHIKLLYRADSRAVEDPLRPWDWWSDASKGGGTLGAIGSHAVDTFHWLLGTRISKVFCQLATHIPKRPDKMTGEMQTVTTDDEANLLLRFEDGELAKGATGAISMSVVEAGQAEHRLEVFGSAGALMFDGEQLWRAAVGEGVWRPVEVERGEIALGMRDSEWARGFTAYARLIVAALLDGRTTVEDAATFDDGYRTQLVLDGAHLSHEQGGWAAITGV